jgi:hypothetical protein
VVGLACFLCLSTRARADTYEQHRTERLLNEMALEPALLPEGRRIAWVRIVSDDVFVEDEVWPNWPNWFHGTTKEGVVRQELLFAEGESYREARIEETMRNLRGMGIFALVRIVPVAVVGSSDVGVLVHTRDIWSLRLETAFEATTFVDQLVVNIAERNLLGRNKTLALTLNLLPQSYGLSQYYYARRVWGSSVSLQERAGVITNRQDGRPEGSVWLAQLGQPYYNLQQRLSWRLYFAYDDYIARKRSGKEVRRIDGPNVGPELGDPKLAWRQRDLLTNLLGSIRVGEVTKQTFSVGWDARRVYTRPVAETELVPELANWFRSEILPKPRTEVGPIVSYELLTARFATFENLSTYGQSENVRIGPSATFTTRLPLSAFGSNTDSWVVAMSAGMAHAAGGFWLDSKVEGRARYEGARLVDQRLELMVRGASPILFRAFRLVARSYLEARRRDRYNTFVALGASNGLRGYISQQIGGNGASRFLTNVELRTMPLEWQAVHIGAVLFYDVGTVFKAVSDARLYHAVGLGVRVLFPQFNRYPFSVDAGTSWDPDFRMVPTFSSKQVVPLTVAEDPES